MKIIRRKLTDFILLCLLVFVSQAAKIIVYTEN